MNTPKRRVVQSHHTQELPSPKNKPWFFATFWQALQDVLCCLWNILRIFWYWFERIVLVCFLVGLAWWLSLKPSLYRDWDPIDARMPEISFSGDTVTIANIRDNIWTTDTEYTPQYRMETYDLDEIEAMYYVLTPFSDQDGPAHTMFSFTFSGGRTLAISPEIRKEQGESFDAVRGVLNQYEIYYLIATESDVIKLRTNYRNNEVYAYPIRTEKEKIQSVFHSLLIRADKLAREPEFYNTIWNNCATSLLAHTNAFRQEKLQMGIKTLLPAHSDEIVYQAGLIDTNLPFPEARQYYRIDELARQNPDADFSSLIRKSIQ